MSQARLVRGCGGRIHGPFASYTFRGRNHRAAILPHACMRFKGCIFRETGRRESILTLRRLLSRKIRDQVTSS
jgi:hypothetical protein